MINVGQFIVLLDSMSFLNASLEKLVDTLKASKHDFPYMKQWIRDNALREKLLRKGVYPYEYVTGMKVIKDKCLPPPWEFYSRLSMSDISREDYFHAKDVWDSFGCETLEDYTKLYCKADTYQLAEAIMELRESLFDEFKLDLCLYLSLPMMAKDIMLKHTGCRIGLMSDIEMIHMVKSNIRGGLSFVNNRYFNREEEKKTKGEDVSAVYVDANNLYGAAMRFPMPQGEFEWMDKKQIEQLDIEKDVNEESEIGYIFEVTLNYPEHLHLDHSSFPLAPHQMSITEKDLSQYAEETLSRLKKTKKHSAKKLTATFLKREKYVCHGLNLKLYLELGMELVEIHRGITFHQSRFLKPYIDMCTQKRAEASTKTRSNMMKLLSNSLYGKVRLMYHEQFIFRCLIFPFLFSLSHFSFFISR